MEAYGKRWAEIHPLPLHSSRPAATGHLVARTLVTMVLAGRLALAIFPLAASYKAVRLRPTPVRPLPRSALGASVLYGAAA